MANPRSMLRRISALNTDAISEQAITETEGEFVELNQQQMYAGVNNDGSDINPQYKARTVRIKNEKGQPTDRVTLKDTGAFYEGMGLEIAGDTIKEFSTDPKNDSLVQKYGPEIFGLGGTYKKEYVQDNLRPVFQQKIEEATGLKFK